MRTIEEVVKIIRVENKAARNATQRRFERWSGVSIYDELRHIRQDLFTRHANSRI